MFENREQNNTLSINDDFGIFYKKLSEINFYISYKIDRKLLFYKKVELKNRVNRGMLPQCRKAILFCSATLFPSDIVPHRTG